MEYRLKPKKKWIDKSGAMSWNIIGWIVIFLIGLTIAYAYIPEVKENIDKLIWGTEIGDSLNVRIDNVFAIDLAGSAPPHEIFSGGSEDLSYYSVLRIEAYFDLPEGQLRTINEGSPIAKLYINNIEVESAQLDVIGEWILDDSGIFGLWATISSGVVYVLTSIEGNQIFEVGIGSGITTYEVKVYDVNLNQIGDSEVFIFTFL